MTLSVTGRCPKCRTEITSEIKPAGQTACPKCSAVWPAVDRETVFESCPFCQCRQFYIQKQFNRLLGCAIILLGVLLVPITYSLSLPIVAIADWIMYRKVPTIVICYRCGAEFRGFPIPGSLKEFMHHIGEKYEREGEKKHETIDKQNPMV